MKDRFALAGFRSKMRQDRLLAASEELGRMPVICMECGKAEGQAEVLVLGKFIIICSDCIRRCETLVSQYLEQKQAEESKGASSVRS